MYAGKTKDKATAVAAKKKYLLVWCAVVFCDVMVEYIYICNIMFTVSCINIGIKSGKILRIAREK